MEGGGGTTKTLNQLCQKPRSREKIRRNTSTPVNPQGRRVGGENKGNLRRKHSINKSRQERQNETRRGKKWS